MNSCCNPFLYAIFTKQFKKDCILLCKKLEESRITRGISGCKHSSINFSNRHTPDCTNSIEKHYSDYLYYCKPHNHHHHCNSIGCTNSLPKKQLYSSINKANTKSKECQLKLKSKDEHDDVFHDDNLDEESLLKLELTNCFLRSNYNLVMDRIGDGSRLVCKCGITTMLPKSKLFFDNCMSSKEKPANKLNSPNKLNLSELKAHNAEKLKNKTNLIKQQVVNDDEIDELNEENVKQQTTSCSTSSKSKLHKFLNSLLGDKLMGKKNDVDKEKKIRDETNVCDKCDCALNANEMKQDLNATDLFFKQHIERLQQQLIKSKQRLDSISSENFSSRSDSLWRQQASQQLKLIEKYFNDKIKQPPSLLRYDRKNSTTNSLSTSTFRISRSSVSSDNFKQPFDRFDKRGLTDDDLRRHLFENRLDSCKLEKDKIENCNDKLARNQINSEILNNLFKEFLCFECASNEQSKDGKLLHNLKANEFKEIREFEESSQMKEDAKNKEKVLNELKESQ